MQARALASCFAWPFSYTSSASFTSKSSDWHRAPQTGLKKGNTVEGFQDETSTLPSFPARWKVHLVSRNVTPCSSSPLVPPVSCFSHVWPSDGRRGDRQRCQLPPPTKRWWETTQPEDGRGEGEGREGLLTFPHNKSLIEISESQSTC